MTHSIRTFLLINLLLSVILITSLAIVGNLFLTHKDIQTNLDSTLIISAKRINAIIGIDLPKTKILTIQEKLNTINANKINKNFFDNSHVISSLSSSASSIEFQIWQNNTLILHSKNMPSTPLMSKKTGFSNVWSKDRTWRVYTLKNKEKGITIVTAEHGDYRQHLENQLTRDSIFIMLATYPFLGILIWAIIGKGLRSLQSVTSELKHRDRNYLEPVDLKPLPTEVEPLIDELNSLFYRLKEAFNRHERFTSDAAHELRTPLAALSTQIQVSLRADTPEARNQSLLKVLGGVNRCTHLIQQLLTLSRMAPEAGIQNPVPVKLSRQASDVAAMLAPEAITKNIDLELASPNSDATIIGNPTAINILIRNLVDNAIRYTPVDSFVKIDINESANHVILQVIDNGPGIPKNLRERVFERFYRMIGNKASGTGLGLGIVLQITKLHKATIELLEPKDHGGLEVKITFPKTPE
ncbi:MAG: two-component sensor histidine kinase [Legionellales bacterium]|nr:two-component sensor histidine kinase [Legionellales bacterium]